MSRAALESFIDAHLNVIEALMDGPKTIEALIEASGLSKASAYSLVNRLEDRFLVIRRPYMNPETQRRASLYHWCPTPGQIPETALP